MSIWKPSQQWLDSHTSSDLVYEVVLDFESTESRDEVLREASTGRLMDDDAVLVGGAALEAQGETAVLAGSGGEDALDSLDAAINDVLGAALGRVGDPAVRIVSEERRLER